VDDDLLRLYEALLVDDLEKALARLPEESGTSLYSLLTGLKYRVEPARCLSKRTPPSPSCADGRMPTPIPAGEAT
jgi:hypothetical protein